ncbi:hypothetical protein OM076_00915 [Solirubrobacter ginsenosidimutans]|uniref:Uncharacterized protein n=1 Tax=Solirubrobacter ginsenosidimutans TaxID=490573 RepID=A0A9X3MLW4_9ACTN|nr:hypothetical protein [Solirubrobacter ginsenosidimutans]MDA0158809.1 hypothetical protein [Solirubrobacter ginsenosidimutans]
MAGHGRQAPRVQDRREVPDDVSVTDGEDEVKRKKSGALLPANVKSSNGLTAVYLSHYFSGCFPTPKTMHQSTRGIPAMVTRAFDELPGEIVEDYIERYTEAATQQGTELPSEEHIKTVLARCFGYSPNEYRHSRSSSPSAPASSGTSVSPARCRTSSSRGSTRTQSPTTRTCGRSVRSRPLQGPQDQ